jgi:hypothetical protein
MFGAFHHSLHRRPGRVHIAVEHWLLTAGSLVLTVLTVVLLFLVIFVTRAT